jgi:Mg-chelatase subunit ChlD
MTRQFFATEFEVVEAEQTLKGVVDELGLDKKWGTNKAGAMRRLKDAVKTGQVRGTDLIEIKVEEDNAADARLIAERVAKAYQERRTKMEMDRAEQVLSSLEGELREQEDLVEEKRKVLDTVVQAIGIPYVEGVRGGGEMGRSQEGIYELAERNLYELEKEKQQLEIQIKTLQKNKGKELMEYAAGLQLPGNAVPGLYVEYQEAVRDLDNLRASGLGASHPDVAMKTLNVEKLRLDLEKLVGSLQDNASVDLAQGPTKEDRQAEAERRLEEARRLAAEKKRQALLAMEKSASDEAFSTFSLHVSDVSFKLAQAALAKGEWPEAERVRVEEFVNAFDYGDPAPSRDEKVACALEQAAHPFMQQRNLLRIAMRTAAVGRAAGTPLRLTVLLDNSGSMERSDRAESVQRAFELLAAQMNPQDEVTLISFARTPRLVRDSVPGDKVGELVKIIRDTPSEGGTNLEEALRLGMEKAREDFLEGAQNRIILLTDGAANLGNAEPEMLGAMVEQMRQQGIAFDACGVGADGLNDDVLEALTRKGDGRYYFLDRPEDADAGFAKQIAGALRPAAKNVKVQVEFNPKRVGRYRLYGFEKHELKKEDFRDDSVDAAEMAAEEAGVAIYQVETLPDGEGDVGSVSVRFMDMTSGGMIEKRWPIPYEANPASLAEAAASMKLAASAAFLAEKLKGTPVGELVELKPLIQSSRSLQTSHAADKRVEQLIEMMERARRMAR